MALVDHVMILLLFVVQPLHGARSYRRYVSGIAAGEEPDRVAKYRETLVLEWVALAVLLAVWIGSGRSLTELGFTAPGGTGFFVGVLVLVVGAGLLVGGLRAAVPADEGKRARTIESLGDLRWFLPDTRRAYRWFVGLSVTAGIVEETIYRGYVFWYLGHVMPLWAVVVISAVGFGLAHSYQGLAGIARVTAIGIVFGAYYVLTGSIWLPMLAHAVLDILQGAALLEYLRERPGSGAGGTPADSA